MKVLILAEHDNQQLKPVNHHIVTAAKQLGQEIDILILGHQCQSVAEEASGFTVINKIYYGDHPQLEHLLAESVVPLLKELATAYQYILMPATTFGKNILPRLAGALNTSMISDITKIVAADTFERPIYAGNAFATVQSQEEIKLLTIRFTVFKSEKIENKNGDKIKKIEVNVENNLSSFISQTLTQSSRPELTAAKIVISGGRGLKSAENFKLLEDIADLLGAAIGASRAAVDAGFAPNDYQVGQTGKVVAPDLYIAVGISGAIQHLAGIKDSKTIVAINHDAEAPIFSIADYGLVGDLFKILPQLKEELMKDKRLL